MKDWDFDEAARARFTRARLWMAAAALLVAGIVLTGIVVGFPAREEPAPPAVTVYYICETNERFGNATFIVGVEHPLYGPWPSSFFVSDFDSGFSVRCRNWEGR